MLISYRDLFDDLTFESDSLDPAIRLFIGI